MGKLYKPALLVHIVLSAVLGVLMLAMPGRFLSWIAWLPIDAIISRILGAALLALAWGEMRVWRGGTEPEANLLLEMQLAFAGLAALGVLRHLIVPRWWPWFIWLLFAVLVAFAVIWAGVLWEKGRKKT